MATPKFDRICTLFVDLIGAKFDSTFTIGGAMPATNILTAAEIAGFVNLAMHKIHTDTWRQVQGNKQIFANTFPELVSGPVDIIFTTGIYAISTDKHDIYKVHGAYISGTPNKFIVIHNEDKFALIQASLYSQYTYTADKPCIIQVDRSIYIFPQSITTAKIIYIKMPILASSGGFIVQNGIGDSPFLDIRNTLIAQTAAMLYLQAAQGKG